MYVHTCEERVTGKQPSGNLRAQIGFYEQIGLEEIVKFAKVLNNSKNTSKVKCKVVHIAA